MARGKCIDEKIRLIIIKLSKSGQSNSEIANLLDLSRYSVRNIVRKCKKYVRKSKITAADRRALRRIIEKNRRVSCLQLRSLSSDAVGRRISRPTCHRKAHKMEFSTYKAKEKTLLTPLQKENRLR
ncbi:hypothetical protein ILUMI_00309 [Ignelater luminosus]|uniref:Transposase Tc1-like domain-containing protein n=1 Tax=Ignelater luminosus TaxID=2038154 RepID=A0A8K0DMJ5_IGNLU|nr:hypothetical protein ILUMI_00309 [Ignelater luminosus]